MEQIRKFLRDKGFALALLACLVAAAAAGGLGGAHRARRAGQEPFGPEDTGQHIHGPRHR